MPTTPKRKFKKKPSLAKIQRQVVEYIKKIEFENNELKTNPESVAGQVIPQLRQAITQNKRLSVLAASLIEAAGGSITVSKALLESFETKVLSIKWEVPEGTEDATTATDFVFKYEAISQEEADATVPHITVTSNDEGVTEVAAEPVIDATDEPFINEAIDATADAFEAEPVPVVSSLDAPETPKEPSPTSEPDVIS
jgi:hypothetical protein